MNVSMCYY